MDLREALAKIQIAALDAVDPELAVQGFLSCNRDELHIAERAFLWDELENIFCVAIGKAAVPMATAAFRILGAKLTSGIVVTKYEHTAGYVFPVNIQVFEAGHPVPDAAGIIATQAVVDLLSQTESQDLLLLLISGGASALLPFPASGLTLDNLQHTTALLLRAGATIGELNAVRKHLSGLKGGQLMRHAMPATVAALVLSDVIGDPLDVIASGLTVPDPTTFVDAQQVLARYEMLSVVTPSIRQHIEAGVRGDIPDTPKAGDAIFDNVLNCIIISNRHAALAARDCATHLGFNTLLLSTFVEGEAREVAKVIAALAKNIRAYDEPVAAPACLILGGETTVTVRGSGKGGRNQEMALSAALSLVGMADVAFMALATDGTDGPTDAAGAIVEGTTLAHIQNVGGDIHLALRSNNAYPLLNSIGALLHTGPTGTNVNDLMILLVV